MLLSSAFSGSNAFVFLFFLLRNIIELKVVDFDRIPFLNSHSFKLCDYAAGLEHPLEILKGLVVVKVCFVKDFKQPLRLDDINAVLLPDVKALGLALFAKSFKGTSSDS